LPGTLLAEVAGNLLAQLGVFGSQLDDFASCGVEAVTKRRSAGPLRCGLGLPSPAAVGSQSHDELSEVVLAGM
jgi:hypothetical protein